MGAKNGVSFAQFTQADRSGFASSFLVDEWLLGHAFISCRTAPIVLIAYSILFEVQNRMIMVFAARNR
jgi:hypothetical protein